MEDFVLDNLPAVIYWAPWFLAGVAAFAAAGIWRLGRGRRFLIPQGEVPRGRALLLVAVLVVSLFGIVMVLGPLGPISQGVHRLDARIGQPVPDLAFHYVVDDSPHRLSEFNGKVVLLNLWATWCGPCVGEISDLNRLHADYESEGLVVVSLSNEPRDDLLSFDEAQPVETVSVYTESVDWFELGEARPVTFFIDRQGVLREYILGAGDYEFFEKKARKYLN